MTLQTDFAKAQALFTAGDTDAAEAQLREILALLPHQPDTLHLAGLIALRRGNLQQALGLMRQSCAAPTARSAYFSNFAELCRQAGLYTQGEAAARHAVAMDADAPGHWNNLGIILQESGKYAESKICLQRVLALTPDNPQAHNNFANTCKRLGELGLAEKHWLQALALQPDYAEPHSNLSTLFADAADYDRAATHARAAISLRPDFADAYLNLAMVETARRNHAAALALLDQAIAIAPANATALSAKALALKELDRLEEALEWARKAASAAPSNAEVMHALATIQQALGDTGAAREAYRRAAALPGTAAEKALGGLALLDMEQGNKAAANAAFDAAVRAHPRSATLRYNRADLKRFTAGDSDIGDMLALLGPDGCESPADRIMLRFALATAYLQLGDGENAFLHLDEGNRMKRATFTYNVAASGQWMQDIARHFSSETLHRLAAPHPPESAGPAPIFVLGMPRSGTTLVEQILASHPNIHGAGELNLFANAMESAGPYPAAAESLEESALSAIGQAYIAALHKRVGTAIMPEHAYIIDKMPANFLYAGAIHAALPHARIIHCRRNPIDTCLSCYSKLFTREQLFTYNQTELGAFHRHYQSLMAHWRRILPATNFLEIAYETMVDDKEAQTRRLLNFLGLPWSDACLDFHRTIRPVRTASVNQVRQPIYKTSVDRWKPYAPYLRDLLAALATTEPGAPE